MIALCLKVTLVGMECNLLEDKADIKTGLLCINIVLG